MAFLGDFGKAFGLGSSREVGGNVGAAVGSLFGPAGSVAGRSIGMDIGKDIGEIGADTVDVSSPPAGVDSRATLAGVSQTSQLSPGALGGRTTMQPNQAFIGGFGLPGVIGQAGRLLARPGVGGALTGFGAGAVLDVVTDMFGNTKKLVITRKLQRDVKKVFMMSAGDIGFVSANSMMLFGKSLSEDQILMILFKTFKNQGPFVTKAAVRKTASTIRKMERLEDLRARMCPPKRATPRRRTMGSTTKVLQVK